MRSKDDKVTLTLEEARLLFYIGQANQYDMKHKELLEKIDFHIYKNANSRGTRNELKQLPLTEEFDKLVEELCGQGYVTGDEKTLYILDMTMVTKDYANDQIIVHAPDKDIIVNYHGVKKFAENRRKHKEGMVDMMSRFLKKLMRTHFPEMENKL